MKTRGINRGSLSRYRDTALATICLFATGGVLNAFIGWPLSEFDTKLTYWFLAIAILSGAISPNRFGIWAVGFAWMAPSCLIGGVLLGNLRIFVVGLASVAMFCSFLWLGLKSERKRDRAPLA